MRVLSAMLLCLCTGCRTEILGANGFVISPRRSRSLSSRFASSASSLVSIQPGQRRAYHCVNLSKTDDDDDNDSPTTNSGSSDGGGSGEEQTIQAGPTIRVDDGGSDLTDRFKYKVNALSKNSWMYLTCISLLWTIC